jgi:hypothetical protein
MEVTKQFDFCEFKMIIPNGDILPYLKVKAKIVASQTHALTWREDFNEMHIHSSKRRYLKKLLNKLDCGEIQLIEGPACYKELLWLQAETGKKSGFRTRQNTINSIVMSLGQDKSYAFVLRTKDGSPLSGAFCPYDRFSAYHLINASVHHEDPLLNRSNILSSFIAIKKSIELGRGFDFEGSNIPGVAQFYRMMGGQSVLNFRIQMARTWKSRLLIGMKHMRTD